MSVETTPDERVLELAEELGDAIAELPVYEAFLDAKETVEADDDLQDEIEAFETQREAFLVARENGSATNDDLRELQRAQQALHERPKMSEYLQAQSELELQLQELNVTISEPLELDFGEKAGGCCQD
jgi:cell fate (sporulation/competence/biofilm development) regulator YlbF (YheA/YmcA/DUF963 family)